MNRTRTGKCWNLQDATVHRTSPSLEACYRRGGHLLQRAAVTEPDMKRTWDPILNAVGDRDRTATRSRQDYDASAPNRGFSSPV